LLENQNLWVTRAIDLMRGDKEHRERCRSACLNCLLDAQSQGEFEIGKLDRRMTLQFFDEA
jgi:hypothetical protein